MPTFLAFPVSGLVTRIAVGPIDTTPSALAGGFLVGGALGGLQYNALRRFGLPLSWIPVSAAGTALGGVLSSLVVGFGTELTSLMSRGVVTGAVLGMAQALLQQRPPRHALLWSGVNAVMWGLAWWITFLVIRDDVETNYAVFGSSGAIVLTAVLLWCLPSVLPAYLPTRKERP